MCGMGWNSGNQSVGNDFENFNPSLAVKTHEKLSKTNLKFLLRAKVQSIQQSIHQEILQISTGTATPSSIEVLLVTHWFRGDIPIVTLGGPHWSIETSHQGQTS